MSNARSRLIAVFAGLASAVALKWLFDRLLWDLSFSWLYRIVGIDAAEPVTGILSYLVPLVAAVLMYVRLSPIGPRNAAPALRKPPWQSPQLIVCVLVVIVAVIAGWNAGRLFGLPSLHLPQAR